MNKTALSCAGLVMLAAATPSVAADTVRHVPAYDLPTPSTVSPALQATIAETSSFVVPAAMPTTNKGWDALANPSPEKTHARILAMTSRLGLTVSEEMIDGVHCFVVTPANGSARPDRLLMHIHGGAYTSFAGESGIDEAVIVAGATGMTVISVDYRMPPDHPFPTPIDDAVTVWRHIGRQHPRARLGLFGTSTGGAMALAVTQRAIREHLPIPDAVIAGTPWSDLSETGDSYFTNRHADPMVYHGMLSVSAGQYADGIDLKDPRLSPVYGSFADFPPTLLISGTRDLFLSNTARVDRKLRDAGRHSELIVYEGQSHGAYLSGLDYPETRTLMRDVAEFFSRMMR